MMQEIPADLSGYQDDPNKSTDEIGAKSRTSGGGGGLERTLIYHRIESAVLSY